MGSGLCTEARNRGLASRASARRVCMGSTCSSCGAGASAKVSAQQRALPGGDAILSLILFVFTCVLGMIGIRVTNIILFFNILSAI